MNSLQFFLSNLWRWKCNLLEIEEEFHDANSYGSVPDIEQIKESQYNSLFVKLMNNRMVMGFFRYGNKYTRKTYYHYINAAKRRIVKYEETGNLECLIDAANILRMEFDTPQNPKAYFKAEDDGEHSQNIK
jgi:hypothetical protein